MTKTKVISVANQKGVGKNAAVYNLGGGLAINGKKILGLDVDPQGDITKMLGQRRPHDLLLTFVNSMNDVVAGTMASDHPEIMHHQGLDFAPENPTELTFHSDWGGQYTSDTFFKLLRQGGVKQSFSRSGRPCDNAVAETFLLRLSGKRHIEGIIPLKQTFGRV